jgi:aminomethyltransferase
VTPAASTAPLKQTALYDLHVARGAKMVAFAGYEMPVQYPAGIIAEHLHTRAQAGLFDVSHMGQARLSGVSVDRALETLVPGDLIALADGRMRYTLLLNDSGGIIDDLMVTRVGDTLTLVVNAACKDTDFAHLRSCLGRVAAIEVFDDRALLALQGPAAVSVLARHIPGVATMPFLSGAAVGDLFVTRSGYTGEDGFELSLPAAEAAEWAERLLAEPEVAPIGLGARDTLRLEAGLCLYGHDIGEGTNPVEAGLAWTIGKRRREEADFPGAQGILAALKAGPSRRRVGILPDGRAPARDGTVITDAAGNPIGAVTSGGFGPSVGGPVAMGYVAAEHAAVGTALSLVVRDVPRPARVVALPFVATRYYRG